MSFKIYGEYNTAIVHTNAESVDASAIEQISEIANHPMSEGDGSIHIMPDFHWGAGAVIGFTMPLGQRAVPNTIGVDIGCGMLAVNFGKLEVEDLEKLDKEIRARVPTGFNVHDSGEYHVVNDLPWGECKRKLRTIDEQSDIEFPDPEDVYDDSYFNDLCKKVGYDNNRAIDSVGTLGGGNHFIELGMDSTDNLWCIIHSGSRGIGASIAQYWQSEATDRMNERAMDTEIPEEIDDYLTSNWKPRADKIREDFDGKDIQHKFDEISQFIQQTRSNESNRNTDLDYLEGDEMVGYIIDMIFAQTYASESRNEMMVSVEQALDEVMYDTQLVSTPWRYDEVESVHNYIDFDDLMIRKGACRAHKGEKLVVPFNMKYGTIIAQGKGKKSWNNSSAHGAGRAMSPTTAKRQFTEADFDEQTEGVFMSEKPMGEIPGSYKSPENIEKALGENVEVIERVTPIISIKAK